MRQAKVHLCTFYDSTGPWKLAAQRLARDAKNSGVFESINLVTEKELAEVFPSKMSQVNALARENERGFGLWAWKPLVGQLLFDRVPAGDIILYLDAGCVLNFSSHEACESFEHYVRLCSETGSLFFQQGLVEKNWTSKNVLDFFYHEPSICETGQLLGGIWFLQSSSSMANFLNEWWTLISRDDFTLLKGEYAGHRPNRHRHDQSIASCLAKREGLTFIPDQTYFSPDWDLFGRRFPIWATRLRLPFRSAYGHALLWRILRFFERVY